MLAASLSNELYMSDAGPGDSVSKQSPGQYPTVMCSRALILCWLTAPIKFNRMMVSGDLGTLVYHRLLSGTDHSSWSRSTPVNSLELT